MSTSPSFYTLEKSKMAIVYVCRNKKWIEVVGRVDDLQSKPTKILLTFTIYANILNNHSVWTSQIENILRKKNLSTEFATLFKDCELIWLSNPLTSYCYLAEELKTVFAGPVFH